MIKVKVLQDNGDAIADIESEETYSDSGDVIPTNNFMKNLFSREEFYLQRHNLSADVQTHTLPYKCMIDQLTTCQEDSDAGQLFNKDRWEIINSCSCWKLIPDNVDTSKMDKIEPVSLKIRSQRISKSRELLLIGPLSSDFASQPRLILNNVTIGLKLWQNNSDFALLSGADKTKFKIQITDARLNLCHVTLTPELTLAINDSLKMSPCQYPFDKSIVKSYTLVKGIQTVTLNDIFTQKCPDKIYICMVETDAFVGNVKQNPFYFQHMNLSELGFFINNRSLPGAPVKMSFGDSAYQSDFIEMYQNLLEMHKNINITYEEFYRGYTIFVFDLSTTKTPGMVSNVMMGQTKLEMRFDKPLANSTTVIIYGKTQCCVSIDQARNVSVS